MADDQAQKDYQDYLSYQDYLKHISKEAPPSISQRAIKAGGEALSTAGKYLDYPGGIARTAGAYPFVKDVTGQDVLNAFKAQPLSGNQILTKAGVPEGASLSDVAPWAYNETGKGLPLQKGGWADPSARGTAGLALEMATDPGTYLSLGASRAAKTALQAGRPLSVGEKALQYAARPIGAGLEDLGKSRYASAFKKVDKAAENAGQLPVSPVFLQKGMPVGDMSQLQNAAEAFKGEVGGELGNIRRQAAQQGATVDMLPALDEAMNQASVWRQSPHPDVQAAAQKLDDITSSYLGKGTVPVDQASRWATEANDLGRKVYGVTQAPLSHEGNAAIGQGLAGAVEEAIGKSNPEIKNQYRLANQQYSALAGSKGESQMANMAKAEQKNGISAIDAILGGLALGGGGHVSAVPLVAKKGVEFLNSTKGRTLTGRGLYELGNKGDVYLRRPSVWKDIGSKPEEQK